MSAVIFRVKTFLFRSFLVAGQRTELFVTRGFGSGHSLHRTPFQESELQQTQQGNIAVNIKILWYPIRLHNWRLWRGRND